VPPKRSSSCRSLPAWPATPTRPNDGARHDATGNRLIGTGLDEATADASPASWEARATHDGLDGDAASWEAGWAWIVAQRERQAQPTWT